MNNKRNSIVILAKNINMDKEYQNIIDYSESDIVALCRSNNHLVSEQNNYSFLKIGDNRISVGLPYETCLQANYIALQNPYYSNKWFFGFIDKVEYSSEKSTVISYTVDEISTWWSYWNRKECFIVREHVNDDTIGLHTVPEGLETGDYIEQDGTETSIQIQDLRYLSNTYIVMGLSDIPNLAVPAGNRLYGDVYSGLTYVVFDSGFYADQFIRYCEKVFSENIIYSVFMIPSKLANLGTSDWIENSYTAGGTTFNLRFAFLPYSNTFVNIGEIGYNKENYLDQDYVPKNKKLMVYPYRYLVCSNNAGSTQIYKYELFKTSGCGFRIDGVVTPGCSIKIYPENYAEGNIISSLDAAKLPTCSWTNDAYTNWLTQNSVNLPIQQVSAVGKIVGGIGLGVASGGMTAVAGYSMAAAGVRSLIDTAAQVYEHSLVPNSAQGGANNGDLLFAKSGTFSFYKMSIKKEFAEIIDNWFSKFGYKVNTLKTPNFTGRRNWNFVQIGDGEIIGYSNNSISVPESSMDIINAVFRKGTTIWHNHENIGNYSLDNSII